MVCNIYILFGIQLEADCSLQKLNARPVVRVLTVTVRGNMAQATTQLTYKIQLSNVFSSNLVFLQTFTYNI